MSFLELLDAAILVLRALQLVVGFVGEVTGLLGELGMVLLPALL